MNTPMQKLALWYLSQCNGDWEHEFGVEISTLDNPGWRVSIQLTRTDMEGQSFARVENERSEHDWVHCWVSEDRFEGACGPLNLEELVQTFVDWAIPQVPKGQLDECKRAHGLA